MAEKRRILQHQLLIEILLILALVLPWIVMWGIYSLGQIGLAPYLFAFEGIALAGYSAFVIWRWDRKRKGKWYE